MINGIIAVTCFFLWMLPPAGPDLPQMPPDNRERPLSEIFREIEQETGYRFLYREALVAGKTIPPVSGDDRMGRLKMELNRLSLDVAVDSVRKQIVIFAMAEPTKARHVIQGYVLDNHTGERLPFATVLWNSGSRTGGMQTDPNGEFHITVEGGSRLVLDISYVGYQSQTLAIDAVQAERIGELAVRLVSAPYTSGEIMITASAIPAAADTVYQGLLKAGKFSPLGETNSIRMLQTLPSVSPGTAYSGELSVRGSHADAFQILLDGSVIYNHSHLFGLLDSFNPDAIRVSSFYYDITPAAYQAPPGGTLSLVTRTGSLNSHGGKAGLSNSVARASLEGPIVQGRSSWMISGRHSLLNTLNWFKADELVSWGLDINREHCLSGSTSDETGRMVRPGDYDVKFYDLHGKLYFEQASGSHLIISGYSGGNLISQTEERLGVDREARNIPRRLTYHEYSSENRWYNHSAGVQFLNESGSRLTQRTHTGISYYHTLFSRENFHYRRPADGANQPAFTNPFKTESELLHWYAGQDFSWPDTKAGVVVHGYRSAYLERSFNRPEYFQRATPFLFEAFLQSGFRLGAHADLSAGTRLHYFSGGNFLRTSPRLRITLFPGRPVSAGFGYSRNHQFLYRLSFYNLTTADIWITATDGQPPAYADQLTAGLYLKPWRDAHFQVEGYRKIQHHLRFHEINFQILHNSLENQPWFYDNSGHSRGLEFLFRQNFGIAGFTQTYTFGVTELQNRRMNNGQPFYAEWDRRHQSATVLVINPLPDLSINAAWIFASGVPSRLELFQTEPDTRLGHYHRLDLSLHYTPRFTGHRLHFQAGIYNALNRKNPWYREVTEIISDDPPPARLVPVQVDVYDLGFQPSFLISYDF